MLASATQLTALPSAKSLTFAVDSGGHVWLADESTSQVLEFDAGGNYLGGWLGKRWNCGAANDQFCHPMSVAFDKQGAAMSAMALPRWSLDDGNHRIQVFAANGRVSDDPRQHRHCRSRQPPVSPARATS